MENNTPPKNDVLSTQDFENESVEEMAAETEDALTEAVCFDSGHQRRARERLSQLSSAPSSKGATAYAKYLQTGKIGLSAALLAKCCECSGFYFDGRADCGCKTCPLYPRMPYRADRKKYVCPNRKKQ